MEDKESIPRQVAKWLVVSAIDLKTTQIAANTVDNYTGFDKDSLAVKLGTGAIGMVVAANLKPVTDKYVDKAADFINLKRMEFVTKKNEKKKEQ